MGVQITFDYVAWARLFPQWNAITRAQIEGVVLPLAEQYCRNDGGGPATTAASQTNLLNLMVAHCTALLYGPGGDAAGPSGLVGRITSAAEGSVNVQADFPTTANSAWFLQTQWGAMFWQASAPYRTARYIPGSPRVMTPWPFG